MKNTECLKCGKAGKPTDKFCPSCGHPVGQGTGNNRSGRRDQLIIIGILAIVAVFYIGYQAVTPEKSAVQQPSQWGKPSEMPVDMEAFTQNLPTDFPSLVSMGNALMDQGKYELAIECYQRAVEIKPKDVNVIVDLGTCQHSLGQNQKAIANFKKALEYEPDHQIAKFNMGIVYHTTGDQQQAIEWWKRLLDENPSPELKQRTEALIKQLEGN